MLDSWTHKSWIAIFQYNNVSNHTVTLKFFITLARSGCYFRKLSRCFLSSMYQENGSELVHGMTKIRIAQISLRVWPWVGLSQCPSGSIWADYYIPCREFSPVIQHQIRSDLRQFRLHLTGISRISIGRINVGLDQINARSSKIHIGSGQINNGSHRVPSDHTGSGRINLGFHQIKPDQRQISWISIGSSQFNFV